MLTDFLVFSFVLCRANLMLASRAVDEAVTNDLFGIQCRVSYLIIIMGKSVRSSVCLWTTDVRRWW